MTKQEYYDLLIVSALDGTFPSIQEDELTRRRCKYRGSNNAKCAIGICIPDEKYTSDIEGRAYDDVITKLFPPPSGMHEDDVQGIQYLHDSFAKAIDWDTKGFIDELNSMFVFNDVIRLCHPVKLRKNFSSGATSSF